MYIVADVFNGEGYSEPNIAPCLTEKDALNVVGEFRKNYLGDGWEQICNAEPGCVCAFESGNDACAIFRVATNSKYCLVRISPDVCDFEVCFTSNNRVDIFSELEVMAKDAGIIDIDANTENVISGHTEDGFVYFAIVQADIKPSFYNDYFTGFTNWSNKYMVFDVDDNKVKSAIKSAMPHKFHDDERVVTVVATKYDLSDLSKLTYGFCFRKLAEVGIGDIYTNDDGSISKVLKVI